MSGISADWTALASHNERLMHTVDGQPQPAETGPVSPSPARWAELASQRERLVQAADPQHRLASSTPASSTPASSTPGASGLRLAVKAA
jgi:hypothetical protein